MKLITKSKEYYDYMARNPELSDQDYIWKRNPKVVDIKFAIPCPVHLSTGCWIGPKSRAGKDEVEAFGVLIFFCGKVIPMAKVVTKEWDKPEVVQYVFSVSEIPEVVLPKEKGRSSAMSSYLFPHERMRWLFRITDQPWGSVCFDDVLKSGKGTSPRRIGLDEMHMELGTPVFCHAAFLPEVSEVRKVFVEDVNYLRGFEPKVVVNPVLSAVDFFKSMDAFSAFTTLERYWTNTLAPKDVKRDLSVVEKAIPDKIKAESHGFDKHSFRKEPTKKK